MKNKIIIYSILAAVVFTGGYFTGKQNKPETQIKEVVKFKERVRTRTIIKERPDGTKETIIVEDRNTKSNTKTDIKIGKANWSLGAMSTIKKSPVYGAQISRRLIGDLWLGGYARTDKEFGVILRFDF